MTQTADSNQLCSFSIATQLALPEPGLNLSLVTEWTGSVSSLFLKPITNMRANSLFGGYYTADN